jgi:death on curing protein
MTDYRFLSMEEVIELHRTQIDRFGGLDGVRDSELLESAVAQPEAGFGGAYLHDDVFEMAAAYLFHLVMNHPFIDGNKRVGFHAAYVFLRLNGWIVTMPEDDAYDLVIAVTANTADKPAIADAFRHNSKRAE